jgi:methylglutaconyl-CoA hydratase
MGVRVLQVDVRRGVLTLTLDSSADRDAPSRAVRAPLRSALLETVPDSPEPVVGVARGPARAGGVGSLAACDVVVAATVAPTEVRMGGVAAPREQRPARWVPA